MNVILVGAGPILYYLARQFAGKKYQLTLVTADADEALSLSRRLDRPVLAGDATEPKLLEEAGALRADVVLALTAQDEDNLAICQIAGQMYRVPRTVALVNDPDNEEVFHRLEVTVAVSATRILSTLLEEQAGFEEIGKLVALAEGDVDVAEVVLRDDSPVAGQTLASLTFPDEALLGGIIRAGRVLIPKGNSLLHGGDRLILIATERSMEPAVRLLTGEDGS